MTLLFSLIVPGQSTVLTRIQKKLGREDLPTNTRSPQANLGGVPPMTKDGLLVGR